MPRDNNKGSKANAASSGRRVTSSSSTNSSDQNGDGWNTVQPRRSNRGNTALSKSTIHSRNTNSNTIRGSSSSNNSSSNRNSFAALEEQDDDFADVDDNNDNIEMDACSKTSYTREGYECSICIDSGRLSRDEGLYSTIDALKNHIDRSHKDINDGSFQHHFFKKYNLTRCSDCQKTCRGDNGLAQHLRYCKRGSPTRAPASDGLDNRDLAMGNEPFRPNIENEVGSVDDDDYHQILSDEERLTLLCATDIPLSHLSKEGLILFSKISTKLMNAIASSAQSAGTTRSGNRNNLHAQINDIAVGLQRFPGVISLAKRLRRHKRSNKEIIAFLKQILDNARPWHVISDYYNSNLYHLREIRFHYNRVATQNNTQGTEAQVEEKVIQKVVKLVSSYKLSAAIEAVDQYLASKDGVAPRPHLDVQETKDYIKDNNLYPAYDPELDCLDSIRDAQRTSIVITPETVKMTLSKVSVGKSAGISGLTFKMMRDLGADHMDNSAEYIDALCKLLNVMASNKIDSSIWTKTRLQLLAKLVGGLRPIAIGETITRLMGACITRQLEQDVQSCMAPYQYGVGCKGGADIIAVTCSMMVGLIKSKNNEGNTKGIIPLDFVNAYGSVRRLHTGKAILKHLPQLFDAFLFLYDKESEVYLLNGAHVATVSSGLRQGCSMATLFFCLAIKDPLDLTASRYRSVFPLAYIDDITVVSADPVSCEVCEGSAFLCRELDKVGLKVNEQKSGAITHHTFRRDGSVNGGTDNDIVCEIDEDLPSEFSMSIKDELACKILGVPVGYRSAATVMLTSIFDKYSRILEWIPKLDAATGYMLLKFCINTRPTYLARNVSPSLLRLHAQRFDAAIQKAFFAMLETSELELESGRIPIRREQKNIHRLLAELPPRFGGAGLSSIEKINNHAYYGNLVTVIDYLQEKLPQLGTPLLNKVNLYSAISIIDVHQLNALLPHYSFRENANWNAANPYFTFGIPANDDLLRTDHRQRNLMKAVYKEIHEDLQGALVATKNHCGAAWLRSTPSHSNAFTWLFSAVNPHQQLKLKPQSFVDAMRLLLQLPVMQSDGTIRKCQCAGGYQFDTNDIQDLRKMTAHALCCPLFGLCRVSRHDLVVKALKAFLLKCLPPNDSEVQVEAVHLDEEGNELPPIDLSVRENHRLWVCDVAVTSPTALNVVERAAKKVDVASKHQLDNKKAKNAQYPRRHDARYFILETSGRIGPDAMNLIDEYAKMNILPHDPKLVEARRQLLKEISVIIWRGNSFALRMARQHLKHPSSDRAATWPPYTRPVAPRVEGGE
jgi:hypothetical protein